MFGFFLIFVFSENGNAVNLIFSAEESVPYKNHILKLFLYLSNEKLSKIFVHLYIARKYIYLFHLISVWDYDSIVNLCRVFKGLCADLS